jgi:hypothetical protein
MAPVFRHLESDQLQSAAKTSMWMQTPENITPNVYGSGSFLSALLRLFFVFKRFQFGGIDAWLELTQNTCSTHIVRALTVALLDEGTKSRGIASAEGTLFLKEP